MTDVEIWTKFSFKKHTSLWLCILLRHIWQKLIHCASLPLRQINDYNLFIKKRKNLRSIFNSFFVNESKNIFQFFSLKIVFRILHFHFIFISYRKQQQKELLFSVPKPEISVTRLGDFLKFLATSFRSKIPQIFGDFMGKCEKQKVLEKLFCLLLANWATFQSIICSHCLLPISRKERGDDDRHNNIFVKYGPLFLLSKFFSQCNNNTAKYLSLIQKCSQITPVCSLELEPIKWIKWAMTVS